MATLAREILTADGMSLRVSCLGMSYIGISVSGTFVGTLYAEASQSDFGVLGPGGGASFKATSIIPYPSGTTVQSFAAPANYFWPVQNYATFQLRFQRTSGSPLVTLAASMDSSWGDAFLTSANKFRNSFANGARNVLTIPADANFGKRLRSLVVTAVPHVGGGAGTGSSSAAGPSAASWASNPILRIYDGDEITGSLLFGYDLPSALPVERTIPIPTIQTTQYGVTDGGIYFTPGSVGTIYLASGGTGVATNINIELATA